MMESQARHSHVGGIRELNWGCNFPYRMPRKEAGHNKKGEDMEEAYGCPLGKAGLS